MIHPYIYCEMLGTLFYIQNLQSGGGNVGLSQGLAARQPGGYKRGSGSLLKLAHFQICLFFTAFAWTLVAFFFLIPGGAGWLSEFFFKYPAEEGRIFETTFHCYFGNWQICIPEKLAGVIQADGANVVGRGFAGDTLQSPVYLGAAEVHRLTQMPDVQLRIVHPVSNDFPDSIEKFLVHWFLWVVSLRRYLLPAEKKFLRKGSHH